MTHGGHGVINRLPLRRKLALLLAVMIGVLFTFGYFHMQGLQRLHTIASNRQPTTQDRQEILDLTSRLQYTETGLSIYIVLAVILLSVIASRSIVGPIMKLRHSAERIANGDFSGRVAVSSKDELGQLAESFNSMADRLREAYRRSAVERQRDEAILQSMGEGLMVVDEHNKVVLSNRITLDFFAITDSVLIGKPIHEVCHIYEAEDRDKTPLGEEDQPTSITLSTGRGYTGVFGVIRPDNAKHLLSITSTPVRLDGNVIGAIAILRDVTKEKEVDRMKTEFISLASHQLRTPLSAIKWFSEMLVSGDAGTLQPEQLDFAKNIADSTSRMIALVNALLNISRIESGRIMIDPKPTDLRELVAGIVNDLKAKTEEKQQSLIISVHQDLPKINLDPRLISQVYLNLLTNAIKYTPKGGEISVFISRKDDEIVSQVTDNGYGIPKDQQGRIFQKFFRAANAVKVETDGTGLGLYLIKAVVESSGGKIWFESGEGKGTTFWFSIPVAGMKPKQGEVTLDA